MFEFRLPRRTGLEHCVLITREEFMNENALTVGTLVLQTVLAGSLSSNFARYGNSTFTIFRFPTTNTETAALVLGVSTAAAQFLLGELASKKIPSFAKNCALSTTLSGFAFAALAYAGEFADLTGKELAYGFSVKNLDFKMLIEKCRVFCVCADMVQNGFYKKSILDTGLMKMSPVERNKKVEEIIKEAREILKLGDFTQITNFLKKFKAQYFDPQQKGEAGSSHA